MLELPFYENIPRNRSEELGFAHILVFASIKNAF